MSDPRLEKHCKVVEAMLNQAAELLCNSKERSVSKRKLKKYKENLQANEFELAMQELECIGKELCPRSGFWRRLKKVSNQMSLPENPASMSRNFTNRLRDLINKTSAPSVRVQMT